MKNNKNNISSLKIECDIKSLLASLVISILLCCYIFFKYGIVQLLNVITKRGDYSMNQIFSLVLSYIVCIVLLMTIVSSIKMLIKKEPRLYFDKKGLMINNSLGKEFHQWEEFESYRIVKKGQRYCFYIEPINKKQFERKQSFAKRAVFFVSYIFASYGVECNFTLSAKDAKLVESIISKNIKFDRAGFKKIVKFAKTK